ncbi:MAG: TIGR03013 family XrtA/PEP-CTERM system glycosyltransferase [Burkholderiaceae bacterium]
MVRVFRHHIPVGTIVQWLADAGIFLGSLLLAAYVQLAPYGASASLVFEAGLVYALLMLAMNAAFGLYRRDEAITFAAIVGRLLLALALGAPLAYLLFYLLPGGQSAQAVLGYTLLYAACAQILLRQVMNTARSAGIGARRVLIVGVGPEAKTVEESLRSIGYPRYAVVGFYQAGPGDAAGMLPTQRVYARENDLTELVRRLRVQEVIVAVREQRGGVLPLRELLECRINGVPVTDLAGFYERVRGEVPIESLKASWLIYGQGFAQDGLRAVVKRAFDVVASTILLILALPVMLLAAIAIYLESGLPIIYRQERVGRGGRTFMCLKFRSMRTDAEKDGVARWAAAGDSRVTRVGRIMRKTRIDELPQLINVLRGDMSLVGPRPERPCFVNELKQQIRFYDIRHSVKPGLTGWAQVRYSYGASVEDASKKLEYDLYYVKNHSLFLDFLILVETVRVVLFREGAH